MGPARTPTGPAAPPLDVASLRGRYAAHPAAAASLWTPSYLAADLDPASFRADNAYVWQRRDGVDARACALTLRSLRARDPGGLLDRLEEDGAFGAETFEVDGRRVSRDLLDAAAELLFLDAHVGLADRTVLDVGAGYGRFAWHATRAFPTVRVLATDGVPESTALCAAYLRARGAPPRAEVVPLDLVAARAAEARPELATNMHSFTEMPVAAAAWWIELAADVGVRWFFVVPNADDHGGHELWSHEADDSGRALQPVFEAFGFRLALVTDKHPEPEVQASGVSPTRYWLFERRPRGRALTGGR